MLTIYDFITVLVVIAVAIAIWHHVSITRAAEQYARHLCSTQGATLLDETIVLKQVKPCFSKKVGITLERRYSFEFSTLGDRRYYGELILTGRHLSHTFMEAFKIPPEKTPLH